MPTPDAIDAAARRVFSKLPHPDRRQYEYVEGIAVADSTEPWWTPGQMCDWHYEAPAEGEVSETHRPHEIPPPDWRDPAVFLRLLMGLWPKTWHVLFSGTAYELRCEISMRDTCKVFRSPMADDPRAALILALDAMLGV